MPKFKIRDLMVALRPGLATPERPQAIDCLDVSCGDPSVVCDDDDGSGCGDTCGDDTCGGTCDDLTCDFGTCGCTQTCGCTGTCGPCTGGCTGTCGACTGCTGTRQLRYLQRLQHPRQLPREQPYFLPGAQQRLRR